MPIDTNDSLTLEAHFTGNSALMPAWRAAIEKIAKTPLSVDQEGRTLTLTFRSADQKSAYLLALNDGHTFIEAYHGEIDDRKLSHLGI